MAKRLILILGGARSGKSRLAEKRAREHGGRVLFVATAEAKDDEMRARIAEHRGQRPADWRTLEAPRRVAQRIADCGYQHDILILDCVTLLTSNVLLGMPETTAPADAEAAILREIDDLLTVYERSEATWLVVSNEVGMGLVPPNRLGRLYRDVLGRVNQRLAESADEALLLVAGLPWRLK